MFGDFPFSHLESGSLTFPFLSHWAPILSQHPWVPGEPVLQALLVDEEGSWAISSWGQNQQASSGILECSLLVSHVPAYSVFLDDFLASGTGAQAPQLEFEQLPFSHPLFIMFSSGTTGAPKCMVHSAGVGGFPMLFLRSSYYIYSVLSAWYACRTEEGIRSYYGWL